MLMLRGGWQCGYVFILFFAEHPVIDQGGCDVKTTGNAEGRGVTPVASVFRDKHGLNRPHGCPAEHESGLGERVGDPPSVIRDTVNQYGGLNRIGCVH